MQSASADAAAAAGEDQAGSGTGITLRRQANCWCYLRVNMPWSAHSICLPALLLCMCRAPVLTQQLQQEKAKLATAQASYCAARPSQ
jgi:hypothetical protein